MNKYDLYLPEQVVLLAEMGATMALSISAGKDSDSIFKAITREHRSRQWPGELYALHADLGRAEWPQSLPHCEWLCQEHDVSLVVVRRPQGDLVQEIEDRMHKLRGTDAPFWPSSSARYCTAPQKTNQANKALVVLVLEDPKPPFWPSSANRYCTSDQKRGQADKVYNRSSLVISVEGIRAEESSARARKWPLRLRKQICASYLKPYALDPKKHSFEKGLVAIDKAIKLWLKRGREGRLALDWYPIFGWTIDEVYEYNGHSIAERDERRAIYREGRRRSDEGMILQALEGWTLHPAYIFGNDRVSCALCVLASVNDLRVGAEHNPWLLERYIRLEEVGGSTFKNGWSLKELP